MIAKDQLLSVIERVERVHDERAALADDLKEIYAEARGNGYDVAALKEVVKIRAKADDPKIEERKAIVDVYLVALGMVPANIDRAHVQAHEAIPEAGRDPASQLPGSNEVPASHPDPAAPSAGEASAGSALLPKVPAPIPDAKPVRTSGKGDRLPVPPPRHQAVPFVQRDLPESLRRKPNVPVTADQISTIR